MNLEKLEKVACFTRDSLSPSYPWTENQSLGKSTDGGKCLRAPFTDPEFRYSIRALNGN